MSMLKRQVLWHVFVCLLLLVLLLGVFFATEPKTPKAATTPTPRYSCEDNSDTTKGHYKGALTHCVPVNIKRNM